MTIALYVDYGVVKLIFQVQIFYLLAMALNWRLQETAADILVF